MRSCRVDEKHVGSLQGSAGGSFVVGEHPARFARVAVWAHLYPDAGVIADAEFHWGIEFGSSADGSACGKLLVVVDGSQQFAEFTIDRFCKYLFAPSGFCRKAADVANLPVYAYLIVRQQVGGLGFYLAYFQIRRLGDVYRTRSKTCGEVLAGLIANNHIR